MLQQQNCLRPREKLFGIMVSVVSMFAFGHTRADDYRLDLAPTYDQGTAHIEQAYPTAHDPEVCKTYLRNLRYFAKKNTPMSCVRPIAPSLKNQIQAIEWEDLDPIKHQGLLAAIIQKQELLFDRSPDIEKRLAIRIAQLEKKEFVFRRAKLKFEGFFDNGQHGPKSAPEGFHIVQYGSNTADPNSPSSLRCKPNRGRPLSSLDGNLRMYAVSSDLADLRNELFDYSASRLPGGGPLISIRGKFYIDIVPSSDRTNLRDGDLILMQLNLDFPIGLESICLYHFKKSSAP